MEGKPLGRPRKQTGLNAEELPEAKAQRKWDALDRIPLEGKFGQGKNGYRLNYIRVKTVKTAEAWIRTIFLVMNLLILSRNLCDRRMSAVKSSFLRCLSDQILALRLELELLGLKTWQFTKLMINF
jgi:IS5 family transposase